MASQITSIHLVQRKAMTSTGDIIAIESLLDADGELTDDPYEAVVLIAGPDSNGKWYEDQVSLFTGTVTIN